MEFPQDYFKFDKSNFKSFLSVTSDVIKSYSSNPRNLLDRFTKPKRVFVSGMGGSGIASEVLSLYVKDEVEVITVKSYELGNLVSKEDLVIISSYSGNTEEAISCYRNARRVGCQVLIHTSGGKLEEMAKQAGIPIIYLSKGYPPRAALAQSFFLLLRVFEELGLITSKKEDVDLLISYLQKTDFERIGVDLSEKFIGKIPIIYTTFNYAPIAYRWKTQMNENAKLPSFYGIIPELNHNELEGFGFNKELFHVVILSFDDELSRLKKRVSNTKQALTTNGVSVTELDIKGSKLNKIFSSILLGDYVSYFVALRKEVDPYPVEIIEKFKRSMGPFI